MKSNIFYCRLLLTSFCTSTIILDSVDSFITPGRAELNSDEIPVHVELVNRKRVRRHISPLSTTPDFEYHLKISSDSDHSENADSSLSYDLKLQPLPHSVFSSAFKFTEFGEDEAGNPVTHSFVPSREELDLIESKLYTDEDTNSFVRLEHENDGSLELYGVVDTARIRTRRDAGTGKSSFSMKYPTRVHAVDATPPVRRLEDMHDEFEPPPGAGPALPSRRSGAPLDLNAWVNIEPELALVFDYQMVQDIGGDWNQKLEYAAITVNGINGYYAVTNDSIRIKCELVHVMTIKSEAQQQWLTNINNSTRVDMGHGRWVMQYDAEQVLKAYQQWIFQHAKEIGKYDIAPIMMGISFGDILGIAVTAGACLFNQAHRPDHDYSAPVNADYGANFEGIPVLAHELGHNLGSPHDGANASAAPWTRKRSTEDCPFAWGFLMGYYRWNHTNAFRFSKCSLAAIKEWVTQPMAACLRPDNKTGRPIIHTSEREGGNADFNAYSRGQGCSRIPSMNFEGVPSYQTADLNCRFVKCEVKEGDEEKIGLPSLVPARYTPCGDNERKGRCRNGWCIGQGPAVDMNSVCKIATRYAESEFDYETTPLDQICSSKSWWCSDAGGRAREFTYVSVAHGTPCGEGKVCLAQKCIEKDRMNKDNKDCVLQTGKLEARRVPFEHPNPKCAGLIKCTFGTEFEFIGHGSTDPDCNPAAGIPESLAPRGGGGDHDMGPGTGETGAATSAPRSEKERTLQDVCVGLMNSTEARPVYNKNRDELCSKLECSIGEQSAFKMSLKGNTDDGIVCGPLRRCKAGECVRCDGKSD